MSASYSPPSILSFTEMSTSLSELQQAHALILKTNLFHHHHHPSRLLTTAATTNLTYAHSIFTHIPHRTPFIFNTMIRSFSTTPTPHISLLIFLQMLHHHHQPDNFTFTFLLKACSSLRGLEEGKQVHGLIEKLGFGTHDVYILNTLIHLYAICGCFESARKLLDKMPFRDVVSWNAMLSAYVEMGLVDLARCLFDEMPEKNLESWNFVITGCVNNGLVDEGRGLFDEMLVRNTVSWNAMITGYAHASRFGEVLVLFEAMLKGKVKPDNCTLVNVLSACANLGSLRQGEWVHAYVERNRIEVNGFLATALVDMYSKCGCIEKAFEVFDNTLRKDISTWNSMIVGLSIHGFGEKALRIFYDMVGDGLKPNEVTFVSILSACSRAGLLNEGRELFDLMVRVYAIQPTVEHYGCMVDLLGRFGLLEEAEELVRKMPMKEAPSVWESLLGACRNHGDEELAERVARRLLELDPQDSAGYVQLSNIHASKGRWNDVMETRRKMRALGVCKEPGCSMIEVDGIVHEFLAGEGMISSAG